MADFVETIKKWNRMCCSIECARCALSCKNNDRGVECMDYMGKHPHEALVAIEKWTRENPELVYPSWRDGWRAAFPNGAGVPCPMVFDAQYVPVARCSNTSCNECQSRPIPADIAQKLSIKPVGDK